MNSIKRLLLIVLVLVSCVGCDQSTKVYAESHLPKTQALSLLADTVRLQVVHNDGAFLSMGAAAPKHWRLAALRIGAGALLLALLFHMLLIESARPATVFALALILAGGAGNLTDRFAHDGYVVDFINIGTGSLRTGIFNVADIAITAGGLLLLATSRRAGTREPQTVAARNS